MLLYKKLLLMTFGTTLVNVVYHTLEHISVTSEFISNIYFCHVSILFYCRLFHGLSCSPYCNYTYEVRK